MLEFQYWFLECRTDGRDHGVGEPQSQTFRELRDQTAAAVRSLGVGAWGDGVWGRCHDHELRVSEPGE